MQHVFLQCGNERCRFRFPAPAADAPGLNCPRCRGPLLPAATTSKTASDLARGDNQPPLAALLDNIRSIHNVGSMFRTADGAGATHLYLAGITATPAHPKLAKAALGAQQTVPWTYFPNSLDAAAYLKEAGFRLWALERTDATQPSLFEEVVPGGQLALVVGNERAGIDPGLLALCDTVVSLPMAGRKSSLNVAVAFGIALYQVRHGGKLAGMDCAGATDRETA